jgi:hypothetical protein
MAVIKIDNFGGEMPSMSPRALPVNAAQTNANLYLGTNEFRPLKGLGTQNTNVTLNGIGVAGSVVRSLYRPNSNVNWYASAYERSFARTPINDAGLAGRTYFTTDEPAGPPSAYDGTNFISERRLGVPPPEKPQTALAINEPVTVDRAWNHLYQQSAGAILEILRNNKLKSAEPIDRFEDTDGAGPLGITIFGGTRDEKSLLIPWASGNPDLPVALRQKWWQLFAKIPTTRAVSLGLDLQKLGVQHSEADTFVPITALPYTYRMTTIIRNNIKANIAFLRQPELPVDAVLTDDPLDDTLQPLFSDAEIDAILDHYVKLLDVESLCRSQRDELTELVEEFDWLLKDSTLDFFGLVEPTPVTPPTKPTSGQYIIDPDNGGETIAYIRNPEWVTYDAQLAAYQQYLKDLAEYQSKGEQAKRSQTDKIYHIQRRAEQVTKEVERILDAEWDRLTTDPNWLRVFFDSQGGSPNYIDIDYVDGIGKEDRFYVVTYVTDWGEESAPSPVSDWHHTGYRDWVSITPPSSIPSRPEVVGWRLYRGNTGTNNAAFQLVTIPADDEQASKATFTGSTFNYFNLGGLPFNDKVISERLGEVLSTTTWLEPPVDLKGLVAMPNGIMAGFVGNTVYFCEPYVPYAWPVEYQVTVDTTITGLGVFGQTLFVGTDANPYLMSGADSATMSAQKLESNQACVSRRSIASVQGGVLYASPDGLCVVDSSGVRLVTSDVYTREDWQLLTPGTMVGVEHENLYYLFYEGSGGGCLVFDLKHKKLGRVDGLSNVTAAFVDRSEDRMYVVINNQVFPFNASGSSLTGRWKSAKMTLPKQDPMAWLQVFGSQSAGVPVTVRWYGDGVLRYTATSTSLTPQRLPPGRWLEHEIEVESAARVTSVVVAGSTQELQQL